MIKDHYVNVPIFDLSVCLWKFAPAWFNMVQVHQISGYQQGSTGRSCSTIRSETNSARLLGTSVSWLGTNRPCGDHHKMAPKPMVISWISHGLRSLLRSLKLEFFGTVDVDIHDYDMMSKISSECHIPWYPMIIPSSSWWHSDGILMTFRWDWTSSEFRPGLVGDPMGHVLRAAEEDLRQLLLQFRQAPKVVLKLEDGEFVVGFWHDCDGISWRMFIGLIIFATILDAVYIYILYYIIYYIYIILYIYIHI